MNIVLLTITLLAAQRFGLSLEQSLLIVWLWWLFWLPCNTWRDFLAGMNFDRMKHGGIVTLPADPEEHYNEPDGVWVVKWVLWLPGALKNFTLAQLAAVFYFRTIPLPWRDVGLTKLINRMATVGGWRGTRALAIRKRWLSRYDRRGIHT